MCPLLESRQSNLHVSMMREFLLKEEEKLRCRKKAYSCRRDHFIENPRRQLHM
jgi:hypothetical protein